MPPVKKPQRPLQRHFMKEWRNYRELSQERAASRLDISRSQLSKIENFKSPYSQGLIEAAAEAYNCTVADLLIRNPLDTSAPWSIMDQLQKATPNLRQQAAAVIETLLKTGT